MQDERKTKRQLIDELAQLRHRVGELEARGQDDDVRQRMEELLRASAEQWYTIFNTMSDAICLLDSQGRIQRCNRAMVELVDRPLGEILDHHCWEVVFGTSEPLDECPLVRMWESLSRENLVMPLGDRWFNVSVDPLLTDDGQSIGAVCVMTDITERVRSEEERAQAEAALKKTEAYLRTVLSNAPITIFAIDNQGLFTLSEGKGLDRAGLKPGENVGVSAFDLYGVLPFTEYDGRVTTGRDIIQRALAGETTNAMDELHGVYFDNHIGPIRDMEGKVTGIVGVAVDITERKRAEEALRESEARYRALFENSMDAVLLTSPDGSILSANAAACRMFERTEEEICQIGQSGLVDTSDPRLPAALAERARTGRYRCELTCIRKDGTKFPGEMSSAIFRDQDGHDGTSMIIRDITDRKQAEEERSANVHFLECMDRVNRAIQGTNDLEQMMSDVLDVVLSVFDCDRASLVYPCDPEAATWQASMERTKPEWPGALALGLEVPMDPEVARVFKVSRITDGPVVFGLGCREPLPTEIAAQFNIQSQMTMALYPKMGQPWNFFIHQCSYSRIWTQMERRLLGEIGRRLEDALASLLMYRDLREREDKYRELADSITDVFFAMDEDLRYTYWNRASENLTGTRAEDAIGKTIFEVFPDTKETRKAAAVYQDVLKEEQPKSFESEYRLEDKHCFFEINAYPTKEGISVFAKDITQRKQAEQALAEQTKQLRFLSARLAEAQEAERQRIARELHDQVGQNLTALGINLNTLRPHLAQAPEEVQSCLDDLLALVKETTGRIRGVMADLRPPELDDYGLLAALRWYADQVGTRTGLTVAVEGEAIRPRLSSQQETALFRIAQEALNNVVKHAQVTQATVTLEASEERVRMIIADDGVGFDPASLETTNETPHWGLLTMRERAQAIGARWCVESSPGQGTRVVVELARPRGGER
jgi:PAS domain S-box-containing protein